MSQKNFRRIVSLSLLALFLGIGLTTAAAAKPRETRTSPVRETAGGFIQTVLCWFGADSRTLPAPTAAPAERDPMDKAGVEIDPIGRTISILDLLPLNEWLGWNH